MNRLVGGIALIVLLTTAAAQARVTRMEISRREPFADRQAFGNVGAYEKLTGRFHGELDPQNPLNRAIVDLDNAPRNQRGQVEYSSDFYILKPLDMTKGNGALLYDVNNRGNKRALIQFNGAAASNDPTTLEHAGNGFLMRNGFTLVWSGWIAGLPAANGNLRIDVPVAAADGRPIEQTVWDEFLFNDDKTVRAGLAFRASATAHGEATLLVRERNSDEPVVIAPEQWEFVDAGTVRLLPAGTPFRIGAIYQLIYRAANPPVGGIGFAATRDLVSFLRRQSADDGGAPNPLAGAQQPAITRTLAHGTSQSGRYLRDFVYRGFNEDETGGIVFDGVNPHIATGRLFLDFRFGQPNRMLNIGHGFVAMPDTSFPWAYETQTDPFTGKEDGILARCAARGNCPKVIHTNSSIEYWQSAQSLVTTDPLGRRDGTPPDNVRIYHFAGTQHIVGATMPKGICAHSPNPLDYGPLLRAALLALDGWVKDATPPPASRYPRIADGQLVEASALHISIPGVQTPRAAAPRPRFDYGPRFAAGIIDKVLPAASSDAYGVRVPAVDRDGNEVAGLRLPEVAVPLATTAGWSVRSAEAGSAGELCYLDGSFVPFARTKAEREATGDARLSREERYRDRADYAAQVAAEAAALERDGYLLAEDVQRISLQAANGLW
jgi:hypothetical protein